MMHNRCCTTCRIYDWDYLMLCTPLLALQNAMREALGLKTTLSGTETRGKITLSYNSAQELEHLYEVIGRLLG